MDDRPRQVLKALLTQYGPGLCDQPDRCRGLLLDGLAGACEAEVNTLLLTLQYGLVQELRAAAGPASPALWVPQLVQKLRAKVPLDEGSIRWAIEVWAEALGVPLMMPASARSPHVETSPTATECYEEARKHSAVGDHAQALSWYRRAAEQCHLPSQHNLAHTYRFSWGGVAEDHAQAAQWYRRAAEQGDAPAQGLLGGMYEDGEGVAQDDVQAVLWYRRSAEAGCAFAQTALGKMYRYGWGVAQDTVQAVLWFRRAAEQGHAKGQYNLGEMYEHGRGIARDKAQAKQWYRRAAAQRDSTVKVPLYKLKPWVGWLWWRVPNWLSFMLGSMYEHGRWVTQSYTVAGDFYDFAAERGYAPAQTRLGWMYGTGKGESQDYAYARELYAEAAEQGYALAQHNLGVMYENGQGVAQDHAQAVLWYRRAAEQGYAEAQTSLGLMYKNGQGVPQDDAQALAWFRKAADQGNANAQTHMEWMCQNGRGVSLVPEEVDMYCQQCGQAHPDTAKFCGACGYGLSSQPPVAQAPDHQFALIQKERLNSISKGFLWGLWHLLPIVGSIILIIKILNRLFMDTKHKIIMFVSLFIPFVGGIILHVLIYKRIGGRFFTGVVLCSIIISGLIGLIGAIVVSNVVERTNQALYTVAVVQIEVLKNALKLYKLDNGIYPTTEQGLDSLIRKPGTGSARNWREGGYLDKQDLPIDPWGNQYVYISPGQNNPDFDLKSFGADGVEGGEGYDADIESWRPSP